MEIERTAEFRMDQKLGYDWDHGLEGKADGELRSVVGASGRDPQRACEASP